MPQTSQKPSTICPSQLGVTEHGSAMECSFFLRHERQTVQLSDCSQVVGNQLLGRGQRGWPRVQQGVRPPVEFSECLILSKTSVDGFCLQAVEQAAQLAPAVEQARVFSCHRLTVGQPRVEMRLPVPEADLRRPPLALLQRLLEASEPTLERIDDGVRKRTGQAVSVVDRHFEYALAVGRLC